MKFFYFLVNWPGNKGQANFDLHNYFFVEQGGFTYGLLIALAAALIAALVYYFVLGKNVTTAKMGNWWICGIVALVATFCISDFVLIGKDSGKGSTRNKTEKITYKYSFYHGMDKAVSPKEGLKGYSTTNKKEDLRKTQKEITKKLNKGGDVRYPYSLNTTIWCAIFYFALSMLLKGFSEAAKTKPLKWPY